MIKVAPSILACDFNNLEKEIKSIGTFKANINLHIEIQAKILIEVEKSEDKKA